MDQGAPEVISGADNRDRSRDPGAREHLVVRHTQRVVNDARISQPPLVKGRAAPTTRRPSSSLTTEAADSPPPVGDRDSPPHSDALGACNSIGSKQTMSPMNGSVGRTPAAAGPERLRNYGDVSATIAAYARRSRRDRTRRRRFRAGRPARAGPAAGSTPASMVVVGQTPGSGCHYLRCDSFRSQNGTAPSAWADSRSPCPTRCGSRVFTRKPPEKRDTSVISPALSAAPHGTSRTDLTAPSDGWRGRQLDAAVLADLRLREAPLSFDRRSTGMLICHSTVVLQCRSPGRLAAAGCRRRQRGLLTGRVLRAGGRRERPVGVGLLRSGSAFSVSATAFRMGSRSWPPGRPW